MFYFLTIQSPHKLQPVNNGMQPPIRYVSGVHLHSGRCKKYYPFFKVGIYFRLFKQYMLNILINSMYIHVFILACHVLLFKSILRFSRQARQDAFIRMRIRTILMRLPYFSIRQTYLHVLPYFNQCLHNIVIIYMKMQCLLSKMW